MRHVIPVNVSQDGGWFGGMLKKRNTLEAAAIFLFGMFVCFGILKFLPLIPKMIIFFIVFMFPAAVAIVGINDQSAMEYIITSIKYRNAKDVIPYLIQTENVPDEKKTLSQRIEDRFKARKESKRQEKSGKKKGKKPKTKEEKKERKAEKKAKKKDIKIKKQTKKKAMKEAKRALKKGEVVSFDPEDYEE